MDFALSDSQNLIINSIKEFALKKLNDGVLSDDEAANFRLDKWKSCHEMNIMGLPFPEEYGGLGMDTLTTVLGVKALARYCMDEGLVFSVCAQMSAVAMPIFLFGTEEQKKKYLSKMISGEFIGAIAISEANAGSDVSSLLTTITESDGGYVINGCKTFITLAPYAQIILVYAKHPRGIKSMDVSAVILEKGEYGIGQIYNKSGLRTSPISEVIIDRARVGAERILGRAYLGMRCFFKSMLWEKILMSAYHVGAMEQQYDEAVAYAREREQFGKKIIEFESIYSRLIEMKRNIETCDLMLMKTCWDFDNGDQRPGKAAMLKLHTSECKLQNSLNASHILGAYGYMKESVTEKQMRDSLAAGLYSGTCEMQRKIIAEEL